VPQTDLNRRSNQRCPKVIGTGIPITPPIDRTVLDHDRPPRRAPTDTPGRAGIVLLDSSPDCVPQTDLNRRSNQRCPKVIGTGVPITPPIDRTVLDHDRAPRRAPTDTPGRAGIVLLDSSPDCVPQSDLNRRSNHTSHRQDGPRPRPPSPACSNRHAGSGWHRSPRQVSRIPNRQVIPLSRGSREAPDGTTTNHLDDHDDDSARSQTGHSGVPRAPTRQPGSLQSCRSCLPWAPSRARPPG